jgi:hypothetical protein
MSVISHSDYRAIAVNFAAARERLTETDAFLFDSVYRVVSLQAILPEVDLVNPLWTAYVQNASSSSIPRNFLDAVRAVQAHVLSRSGLSDIDSYLEATTVNGSATSAITVPAAWAEISAAVGYPIDDANIDP